MSKIKNRCNVCGKVFPEGQGITLRVDDEVITLHSKRCAVKFLKAFVDDLDPAVSKESVRRVKKNFEEILSKRSSITSKKI